MLIFQIWRRPNSRTTGPSIGSVRHKRNSTDCFFNDRAVLLSNLTSAASRDTMAGSKKTSRSAGRTVKKAAPGGEDLAGLRISVTTMGDLLLTAADRYP